MKTVDFSETIAASDLKFGRSRHLIEYMKICVYWRSRSFLDLDPRSCTIRRHRPQCSDISETAMQIKAKFFVEPPWVGGTEFCSQHVGHKTKMVGTPIYGKNPSKNLLLRNWWTDFHKTWYVALGTPAIIVCSNDEPGLTLTYFTARSNFVTLAFP